MGVARPPDLQYLSVLAAPEQHVAELGISTGILTSYQDLLCKQDLLL